MVRSPSRSLAAAALAFAVATCSGAARADAWLGKDKALHFGASGVIAGGAYGESALVVERRWARLMIGASVALAAGTAKEMYDLSGHGDPSWRDFAWDVVGTAFGVGVALLVDWAVRGDDSAAAIPAATPRAGVAPTGVLIRY